MYQAARRTSTDQYYTVFCPIRASSCHKKGITNVSHTSHTQTGSQPQDNPTTHQPINPSQQPNNKSTTTRHNNQQRNEQKPHHIRNNATNTTGQQQHDRRTTQQPHHNNRSTKTTTQQLFKYSPKGCKNQFVTVGHLVTVLDMRPSTTNTIKTNRATKITAHCKLTLLWISYSNPNSLGTRANEPRRSLPQLRKQAQTINATTTGVWHSNYAEPGHDAQSHRPSMTPNQSTEDIHKYARNIIASSYNLY